jgi:hypothetical protein
MWHGLWRRRQLRKIAGHPKSTLAEKIMAGMTVGLLFVGLIQAYIYWKQSVLMQMTLQQTESSISLGRGQLSVSAQAVTQARDQFLKDERPYIWNGQMELPHLKIGDKVTWNYHYTNFGKSPAIGLANNCQILLAAHKTRQKKNLFTPIHNPKFMNEGFVVPPGDSSGFSTCESEEIANQADIDMHNTYDAAVGMKIFYEYSDTSGNVYTSKVCFFLRRVGISQVGICPTENEIK